MFVKADLSAVALLTILNMLTRAHARCRDAKLQGAMSELLDCYSNFDRGSFNTGTAAVIPKQCKTTGEILERGGLICGICEGLLQWVPKELRADIVSARDATLAINHLLRGKDELAAIYAMASLNDVAEQL